MLLFNFTSPVVWDSSTVKETEGTCLSPLPAAALPGEGMLSLSQDFYLMLSSQEHLLSDTKLLQNVTAKNVTGVQLVCDPQYLSLGCWGKGWM